MKGRPEEQGEGRTAETREHLANERTLLSWVRTGVGLISLGIVVERAGTLVSTRTGDPDYLSGLLGIALAVLGCLALVMGTVQFLRNRRRIRSGHFVPGAAIYLVVVGGSLILGAFFTGFVLLTLVGG